MQFAWQVLFRDGLPAIITVEEPGTQGAGITGMQGIGVRTPPAAAVAAATCGLAWEVHMPNGIMLTMGALSRMVAAGIPPALTRLVGKTTI